MGKKKFVKFFILILLIVILLIVSLKHFKKDKIINIDKSKNNEEIAYASNIINFFKSIS